MRSWSVCQTERPSVGAACSSWTGSGPADDDDDELATADDRRAESESEGRKAARESRAGGATAAVRASDMGGSGADRRAGRKVCCRARRLRRADQGERRERESSRAGGRSSGRAVGGLKSASPIAWALLCPKQERPRAPRSPPPRERATRRRLPSRPPTLSLSRSKQGPHPVCRFFRTRVVACSTSRLQRRAILPRPGSAASARASRRLSDHPLVRPRPISAGRQACSSKASRSQRRTLCCSVRGYHCPYHHYYHHRRHRRRRSRYTSRSGLGRRRRRCRACSRSRP